MIVITQWAHSGLSKFIQVGWGNHLYLTEFFNLIDKNFEIIVFYLYLLLLFYLINCLYSVLNCTIMVINISENKKKQIK